MEKNPLGQLRHYWSHPSRVRGLKSDDLCRRLGRSGVAPFTGAWIEMQKVWQWPSFFCLSHPSRVRGLKLFVGHVYFSPPFQSHPSRVRGLKCWIYLILTVMIGSHPSRVRGLKYVLQRIILSLTFSRTLHGCVD